jgi:hypothetical protein
MLEKDQVKNAYSWKTWYQRNRIHARMRWATASCADEAPAPRVVKGFMKCSGLEEPPQSIRTLLAFPGPLHSTEYQNPSSILGSFSLQKRYPRLVSKVFERRKRTKL